MCNNTSSLESSDAAQCSDITSSDVSNCKYNCLVVLGPTAVGKTALAVKLAEKFSGEIISADSRQVYRGLDIGSGKDICEYTVPYHLIDVTDLSIEYSVFDYQKDFYKVFSEMQSRKVLPVICGGTGMYLDSIVRGYDLITVPENQELRKTLAGKSIDELVDILKSEKKDLHNKTDLEERHRLIRAIEIAAYEKTPEAKIEKEKMPTRPDIRPFIIGTTFPRDIVRKRVRQRLTDRIKEGMIEEVRNLHEQGFSWERMERLGLEYRYVSEFLQGKIKTDAELYDGLAIAIGQFVKRQETWFRGMEKKGVKINWLSHNGTNAECTAQNRFEVAMKLLQENKIYERCNFDL